MMVKQAAGGQHTTAMAMRLADRQVLLAKADVCSYIVLIYMVHPGDR